ncbi:MAG: hypothetical protein PHE17_03800 [Thiothrix sp.]|uniref:hypothetical protein n=1 Tax=Thiothrix sp. TaxID=1032 RepID=UPI002608457E|nr:hypothetical protein [Thiothrix sp.]MDD5392126.1 hypothetical protein [Thiothrix sp.]
MNAQTPNILLKNQLDAIEERSQRLLALVEKLFLENSELKKREKVLTQTCIELRSRNDKASTQLETLINRLKQQQNGAT